MSDKETRSSAGDTATSTALVIGAGLGAILGLLIAGPSGLAIGTGLGAGIGIIVGAAWSYFRRHG